MSGASMIAWLPTSPMGVSDLALVNGLGQRWRESTEGSQALMLSLKDRGFGLLGTAFPSSIDEKLVPLRR